MLIGHSSGFTSTVDLRKSGKKPNFAGNSKVYFSSNQSNSITPTADIEKKHESGLYDLKSSEKDGNTTKVQAGDRHRKMQAELLKHYEDSFTSKDR